MVEQREGQAVVAGATKAPVILVVDDEPGIIRMLQVTLQRRSFDVLTATSGQEALEVMVREPVDLVLLDIMMPGLNGLEVTQALRARPDGERVPVIILTAKDTIRDKVAGLELGADDYMTKPVNGEELVARIRVQLRLAGMDRAIRRQNRELANLNAVAAAVGQSLNVGEILGATLDRMAEVEGVAAGGVMVWEAERGLLILAAGRGLSPALRTAWHEQPLAASPWAVLFREAGPGLLEDLAASPDPALRTEAGGSYGNHACVPLTATGRTLGLMHLLSRPPHRFGADEMRFFGAIGRQVGMALENAHLYHYTEQQVSQMRALYEVSSSLTSTLELREVLRALIERLLGLLKVDRCVVILSDATGTIGEVVMGYDSSKPKPWIPGVQIALDRHPEVRRALETKKALVIPDVLEEPLLGAVRDLLRPLQIRSMLVIPLLTKDKALGVIALSSLREARHFTPGELEFCQILANQAAIAIEKARLFQEEQERRRQLEGVRAVTGEITRELDLTTLLGLINRRMAELVGAASGAVYFWDEAEQVLLPRAWHGLGEWMRDVRIRSGEGIAGAVAQRREGMIVNDYRTSAYALPLFLERTAITAVVAEPLLYRDRLVGVITVNDEGTGRPFTEQDRGLLSLFAAQAAIALENARLFAARERAAHEARSLYEVAHSLTTSLDPTEVLRLISIKTAELLGAPHAQVVLWEEETQTLRLGAAHGTEVEKVQGRQFRLGEGVSGIVAQTRAPVLVNDYQAWPHRVPQMTEVVAVIGVPLLYRDRFLGILTSHATQPGWAFTQDHLALLASFADQAAIALENARLYALSQQRLERAQALFATGQVVGGTLDLAPLFALIIAKTAEHLKVRRCALYRVEVQGGEMTIAFQAGQGLSPSFSTAFQQAVGEGTTGKAIVLRRPVWSADVLHDPAIWLAPRTRARVEAEGYRAVLSAPILVQGEPLGALVIYRDEVSAFDDEEVGFLQALGNQAGLALHNAQLFHTLRGQTERLESLIRVSRLIGSSLELDHVLAAIVRTCTELLGMDAATLRTLNEAEGVLEDQMDYGLADAKGRTRRRFGPGVGFIGHVLAERRVLVSHNFAEDPRVENREWAKREGLVAAAGVPLLVGEKALGTLAVLKRSPRTFSEEDIALLTSFANQAAIAIQNARLFAETKRLASTDELTGLFNHRQFYLLLGQEVRRALRYGRSLSLIMLDIDYFKAYNDRTGHLAGDEALRQIAHVLKTNSRDVDMVARYGGEEFIIILPETELSQGAVQAERLRVAVEEHRFGPAAEGNLTVSVGAAALVEGMDRPEQLVHRADQALYEAKASGRNRVCLSGHTEPPDTSWGWAGPA